MKLKNTIATLLLIFGILFLIFTWTTYQQSLSTNNQWYNNCRPAYIGEQVGFTEGGTFDCAVYFVLEDIQSRQAIQFLLFGLLFILSSIGLFTSKN